MDVQRLVPRGYLCRARARTMLPKHEVKMIVGFIYVKSWRVPTR